MVLKQMLYICAYRLAIRYPNQGTVILCRKHLTERFRFFDENVYC